MAGVAVNTKLLPEQVGLMPEVIAILTEGANNPFVVKGILSFELPFALGPDPSPANADTRFVAPAGTITLAEATPLELVIPVTVFAPSVNVIVFPFKEIQLDPFLNSNLAETKIVSPQFPKLGDVEVILV